MQAQTSFCHNCCEDSQGHLTWNEADRRYECTDKERCRKTSIYDSLSNAAANGFDPLRFTVDENVESLQTYDAVCDSLEADEIRPHVISYFVKHGKLDA